ncbi:hypothetical protein [Devosia sp. 2618]|uniref:alpha/beta hydrolase family protein n=1 Tax=Devosia sp. 2618 TaxID=3156454 RepID=UPI003395AD46
MLRPDGSELSYRLDIPEGTGKVPLAVIAQGSGCVGARSSVAVRTVTSAFAPMATLTVEQYGVLPGDDGSVACSADFASHALMSQRVADYEQVINGLGEAAWWSGELVLFGGSEGGLVMARLAPRVEADAAILLSTAPGVSFDQIVLSNVPPEGHETVRGLFERARNAPDSDEKFSGYTFRFWADAIAVTAVDEMLSSSTQFLAIHGGKDPVPVDYSRVAADRYSDAGRCELTYWEFPNYGHGMEDAAGTSHMAAVAAAAVGWASARLAAPGC